MVVVDYYSKFPVVKKLSNLNSSAVIAHLKFVFEEHGIPSKLVTDNGPQYASATFQEFSRSYGFTYVTSSPLYPQSNGLSERTVQTVKGLLQKCKETWQDPHLAMLCLRSTPLSHDLPSPADMLNGRVYQTNLPAVTKPSSSANGDINVKLQLIQDKQKVLYDKTAQQPLQPLFPEDRVRVLNPATRTWEPGIIQDVASTPRSYLVNIERGGTLRRNRRHLSATGESFKFQGVEIPPDISVDDSISNEAGSAESARSSAEPAEFATSSSRSTSDRSPVLSLRPPDPSPVSLPRRSSKTVKFPDRLNL